MTNSYHLEGVSRIYQMGEVEVPALKATSLEIAKGELVVVLGPSGSGKSTLLNIMGGMDKATSGRIWVGGEEITAYSEKELTVFRREQIGFVFQFYNLMPNLTVRENVELATEISDNPLDIEEVLAQVGLEERLDHFPSQLSGGEQQRVAIARAVAKNPTVLLCDEPTGALDYSTGKAVLQLLCDINKTTGKTVVIITHNQPIAEIAHRVFRLRSGEIVDTHTNVAPLTPGEIEW